MKYRTLTLKVFVPILLILYTCIMLGIQLGIPNKEFIFSKTEIQGPSSVDEPHQEDDSDYQNHHGFFDHSLSHELPGSNVFKAYRKFNRERQKFNLLGVPKIEDSTSRRKSSTAIGKIHVFSIYFDNRPELHQQSIRVIAMKRFSSVESLICHFKMREGFWLRVHSKSYEMCENHGRLYGGWIFSCDVPLEILETLTPLSPTIPFIKLSSTFQSDNTTKLKVTRTTVREDTPKNHFPGGTTVIPLSHSSKYIKQKFGVCLPPLFGDVSLSLLIQFIELSKLLGASHITFYKYYISESIQKILSFYQGKGEVTVINWKLPPGVNEREIWYHGQLLAIQDCLYRNMASFKYLIFVDLDEFIIPVNQFSWDDMITDIMSNNRLNSDVVGFSFKSAFFDPKQVPDPYQQLTFLQLLQRNRIISSIRTKLMVQPQKVFELGIHHVSRTLNESMSIVDVEPSVAKIHHYRPCIINYEPNMKCYLDVKDETILKYSEKLVANYQKVIRDSIDLFMPEQR